MSWTKKQITILLVVAMTSFMGTFLISSVNIALPTIEKAFRIDALTLSWIITSFLLSTGMFLLPFGRWGDMFGVKRFFKAGILIFTLSSLLCGFAPSGGLLIIFRFIEGVSAALTNATGSAILVSSFPPQHRGRVLGTSVSGVYLGLAFGPFFGGMLTQMFGWQSIFYLATLLGAVASIFAFLYLEEDSLKKITLKKMDIKGAFLYMAGLILLVYGSSHIPSLKGWISLILGVIALILFLTVEHTIESPILNIKLLTKNRLFAYSNLAALINYSATYAIIFLLSLYLQKIQALSPRNAGVILIAQPIVMALFSPLTGRLSDKIQPRFLSSAGMALCSTGLLSFAFLEADTPLWFIVVTLIWVGFGFALFSSPNMNTIMSSVEKSDYGLASGTASTMRVLGQITSMTVVTILFAVLFDGQTIEQIDNSLFIKMTRLGFALFSVICFAGIYFSYNRGKIVR